MSTAIHYLLPSGSRSHLHRLKSDEVWHFYEGCSLTIHLLGDPLVEGGYRTIQLGPDLAAGERFQAVVPAQVWFGAEPCAPESYTLVGCTVAPGFDFADFELGERSALLRDFPEHRALVERLTRD